jgi:hypothetical protein
MDAGQARCRKADIPQDRWKHRTRRQLCLEMLAKHGEKLPHAWIAGDDELGRPALPAGRLNQNPPQRLGRRPKEMPTAVPVPSFFKFDGPHKSIVSKRGGLQSLSRPLVGELSCRQLS